MTYYKCFVRAAGLLASLSLLWTVPAFSQEDLEEVVVTGSYLPRPKHL